MKDQVKQRANQRKWVEKNKHPCPNCGKLVKKDANYCLRCFQLGPRHHNWKGGKTTDGYFMVLSRNHPNADKQGYVLEHRLVMESHIGRTLLKTEVVHHINGDKKDNRIENLMLFNNHSEHAKHHRRKNDDSRNS